MQEIDWQAVLIVVGIVCLILGGVVPFLWLFVPTSRSGAQCDKDAVEHGQRLASQNKRIPPDICAADVSNMELGVQEKSYTSVVAIADRMRRRTDKLDNPENKEPA